ncbi:hypothetical protein QE152_g22044 [Popillia japonica]|uniref:Uncharacterized protein n=1 Tax=Popillia japonica TaxID=7064 RepID=A0AAW1KLF9_POPJA
MEEVIGNIEEASDNMRAPTPSTPTAAALTPHAFTSMPNSESLQLAPNVGSEAKTGRKSKEHCPKVSHCPGALSKGLPLSRSTGQRSPIVQEHYPKVSHLPGTRSKVSQVQEPVQRNQRMEHVGLVLGLTSVAIAFWFLFRHYWQQRTTDPVPEQVELEDRTNFAQRIVR